MYFMPSEAQIQQVQADINLDRLQAIRHIQQRQELLEEFDRRQRYNLAAMFRTTPEQASA